MGPHPTPARLTKEQETLLAAIIDSPQTDSTDAHPGLHPRSAARSL